MAIALDASSPAAVTSSGAATTTTAFTPPSSSVLVAMCSADANNGSGTETVSVSDSASGTWNTAVLGNGNGGAVSAIFWRLCPTSPGSITVSMADSFGSVAKRLCVQVWTGTDQTAPIGATVAGTTAAVAYTSTMDQSQGISCGLTANATLTAGGSGNSLIDTFAGFDSGDATFVLNRTALTTPASSTVTFTIAGTAVIGHHVAAELVPPSGSTPKALADAGSAADTLAVAAAAPLADAGSAAQALTATVTAPLSDAGSAAQSLTATATIPLTDAGAAADTALAGIAINPGDTGVGADTMGVTAAVPLADGGTGAQALTVTATSPVTDGGTATDSMTVVVTLALADTGHAVDALTVAAAVGLTDAGAGADAAAGSSSGGGSNKTLADGGSATECLCVCKTTLRPNTGITARPYTGTTGTCSCSC